MTDQNALKRAVAAKALDYVMDGMKLGLGSGTTAEIFLELLAPRIRAGQALENMVPGDCAQRTGSPSSRPAGRPLRAGA